MTFKYQEYIDELSIQCPPSDYEPKEMPAFRFVFEPSDERAINNFRPVLIINPQRSLDFKDDFQRCQGYALSFFDNRKNAEIRYYQLTNKRKALRKSLGTHLAEGFIDKTDGTISTMDDNGHFSLHEFTDTDLDEKFVIINSL